MSRERWMALCFALGSTCFLIGPFPGLRATRRGLSRRGDVLRRLDPVHRGRSVADLACVARPAYPRRRARGLVCRARPIRGDGVLQRHHLPGDARRPHEPRVQQAGLATRLARIDLLPRLRRDRLSGFASPRLATGTRRPRLVATGGQPARLHLLRHLRSRRIPSAVDRLACSTRQPRTGTRRWARPASSRALSTRCIPTGRRSCRFVNGSSGSSTSSRTICERRPELSGEAGLPYAA